MLSRQVTCAVRIIYELYHCKPNAKGGRSLKRATLHEVCAMDAKVVRRTLQGLCVHHYISFVGMNATLAVSPDELTLYDLCRIFHNGTPLGEESEMVNDVAPQRSKMPTFVKANAKFDALGKKLLSSTTVGSLIIPNNDMIKKQA